MTKSPLKPGTRKREEAELKRRLVEASRILAMEGHGDLVWGHASVRAPGSDTFWIKPTGMGLDEVRVEDLLLCDLDGEVVQGKGPRHIEVYIHSEVMRARPDVCAVVHTHAIHPTVFASLGVPLQMVTHEATVFVPPDIPRFDHVLAMDRAHLADLRWMSPRALYPRLQLFSTFCPPGSPLDVADPFGLGEDDYERALDQIEVGCHGLLVALLPEARVAKVD